MAFRPPRTRPSKAPPPDPATAARAAVVKLLDKGDGHGVDWRAVTEALFKAAFSALDQIPAGEVRQAVARRVHEGSYNRVTGDTDASIQGMEKPESAPSNTADFNSPSPRPSR